MMILLWPTPPLEPKPRAMRTTATTGRNLRSRPPSPWTESSSPATPPTTAGTTTARGWTWWTLPPPSSGSLSQVDISEHSRWRWQPNFDLQSSLFKDHPFLRITQWRQLQMKSFDPVIFCLLDLNSVKNVFSDMKVKMGLWWFLFTPIPRHRIFRGK